MARCEDFPCCGHELGCCPDFDPETGQQLNMVCVCGAKLPVDNRYSICDGCLERGREEDDYQQSMADEEYMEDEPWEDPVQADADVLRSAGMGTDEDYGYYGEDDVY